MSFQPILPGTGLVGWKLLSRTMETQQAALNRSAEISRDTAYFAANIAKVDTAEQLVGDRRLLRVALGAYGLQEDIDNRYFIQKILADGTLAPDALANKMADDRYTQFAEAFGFDQPLGPTPPVRILPKPWWRNSTGPPSRRRWARRMTTCGSRSTPTARFPNLPPTPAPPKTAAGTR